MEQFEPSGLGRIIHQERYAFGGDESWEGTSRRVADHVAGAEDNGKVKQYADRFYEQIVTGKFFPGGRIMYGAARPKPQLINCYVIDTEDSREGWARTTSDVIIISSLMGGVGINLTPIRPRGSIIKGTGGRATGAVSLMRLINGVGNEIVGGGGRRMALMLCLAVNHPDLPEFLDSKLDLGELNNANISVVINFDTEDFIQKVKNNEEIEFEFNGIPWSSRKEVDGELEEKSSINARELWDRIVENAWRNGEPGVLNQDFANKMNNIFYHSPLISCNPCGEQWLEKYGCCDLGAIVLPRFVHEGKFDWDEFDETVRLGVRFLDDVLTVNHYPLEEIKQNCEEVRRIGLGVMGLHTMLMTLGMKYNSEEGFEFVDRLFSALKNTAYDASINLAIEKGPFPAYDPRLLESGFAKTLKRGIRNKIKEHGLRNCALLTIAPTGTTSLVAGVSSGIEPIPAPVYWRTFFKNTQDGKRVRQRELVVDRSYFDYPEVVQGAIDIPVEDHFKMQKIVQRHIDSAVSKTINLPKDYDSKDLAELWLEYLPYMKGSTFYRFGSREFEPISPIPREEWATVIAEQNGATNFDINIDEMLSLDCPKGVCEIPDQWNKEMALAETE